MSVSYSYLTEEPIQNGNFGLKNKPNHLLIAMEDSHEPKLLFEASNVFLDRVLDSNLLVVLNDLHTAW